jgi:hypothetical protein
MGLRHEDGGKKQMTAQEEIYIFINYCLSR